jgi:hypothetical protein
MNCITDLVVYRFNCINDQVEKNIYPPPFFTWTQRGGLIFDEIVFLGIFDEIV